jgi:hypothetical protein
MSKKQPLYQPVEGKTYSLFGNSSSTGDYYKRIRSLASQILTTNELTTVLETLQKYSSRKRYLKSILAAGKSRSLISYCLNTLHETLKQYTVNTEKHLKIFHGLKYGIEGLPPPGSSIISICWKLN